MSQSLAYLFVVIAVASIASGQLLFKKTATLIADQSLAEAALNLRAMIYLGVAFAIYASATIFWVLALRQLPLARAYMIMAAAFVIVPVMSKYLFGEDLSRHFFLGAGLIAAGVVLTNVQ